jgi:hypothetical protein
MRTRFLLVTLIAAGAAAASVIPTASATPTCTYKVVGPPVYVRIIDAGSGSGFPEPKCGLVGRNSHGVLRRVAHTRFGLACVFDWRAFHGQAWVYAADGYGVYCTPLSRSEWRTIRRMAES